MSEWKLDWAAFDAARAERANETPDQWRSRALETAARNLNTFETVHEELDADDPPEWPNVSHGLREDDARNMSYRGWHAYMQQVLINDLREVLFAYGAHPLQNPPSPHHQKDPAHEG